MNNRRRDYYPLVGYMLILVMVWFASWISDIVTTFMGTGSRLASLVGSEGLRWTMRNALPALNDVPWGSVMLLLAAFGLLHGSGIARLLRHIVKREHLTAIELRSLLFSMLALLSYSVLLYITTLPQWNILVGITGTLENSSFVSGIPLLVFFGILVMSLVYGFMYGNYRSVIDVTSSVGNTCSRYVPALLALIPASGIIASVTYMGVFGLLGLTVPEVDIIATVFYTIPFIHIMFGQR